MQINLYAFLDMKFDHLKYVIYLSKDDEGMYV